MSQVLINYALSATTVKNADGSYPATVTNCKAVTGPGATPHGAFAKVLEFTAGCKITTTVQAAAVDSQQFSATIVFKPTSSSVGVQSLVDCNALPFSIWVQPASVAPAMVGVQVKTSTNGIATTDTFMRTTDLNMAGWNKMDLVYDRDTLALILNGKLVGVTGLPNGILAAGNGTALVLGQSVTGAMQFSGQMAAFTLTKGIPANLLALIAEARTQPEWLISRKYMEVKDKYSFGPQASAVAFDQAIPAYTKKWNGGIIIAPIGAGAAFEVHGLIYQAYKADTTLKGKLGVPLSDEISAEVGSARKNLFTKGAIYYSDATGAIPVFGIMYADYENIGGPKHVIGLPTKAEASIAGGKMQEFQKGHMYRWDGSTAAFEVHGLILEEFKKLGGIGHCGFPLSNEEPALNTSGAEIGRQSRFQLGTIFYHASTGAFEVRGEILTTYVRAGGMGSTLGFPTSHEQAVPGLTGGKANTFQRGTIVSANGKTRIACPFNLFVGRVDTIEQENDGSQNDPMIRVTVKENATEVFTRRFPETGYINEKNIVDLNVKTGLLYPNVLTKTFELSVKADDYDSFLNGGNDPLGTFKTTLNAANCWGWFLSEDGVFNSGKVQSIRNVTYAVQPQVAPGYTGDFWKVKNKGTADLTLIQGASAIRDIDSDPEWFDPFDYLDKAFFDGCIKKSGKGGNCYGLSTYGLKSWKGQALHSPPLQNHSDSATLWNEFRIHQARQFGDKTVGWVIDEFVANRTQNPKEVFTRSRNAAQRGDHPVICFTDSANLLKAKGHCVLPKAWDDSQPIWKITCYDPNLGGTTRDFLIDSTKNTWSYAGLGWSGGLKTGGRLYYVPGTICLPRPRTPYLAVLGRVPDLVSYFISDLLDTVDIVDELGKSLNMSDILDVNATNILKKFLPFLGMGDAGGFAGGLFMRPTGATLPAAALQALAATTTPNWSNINMGDGFTHRMVGKGTGNQDISLGMTHHLTDVLVKGKIDPAETLSFGARNFNSPDRLVTIKSGKARIYELTASSLFGVKGDAMRVKFAFPTKANTDAKVLLDPSMTRIDLLTSGTALPTTITVTGKMGGKVYTKVIDATVEGGTRFDFMNVLQTGMVTGGRIETLKGGITKDFVLRAR